MKVVHLSTSDLGGGAALAAFRVHTGLRQAGIDSWMVVGEKLSDDPYIIRATSPRLAEFRRRMDRQWHRTFHTENQSLITPAWIGSSAWRIANKLKPDVVHLHWIGRGFLRLEAIARLRAPLVWSMHDMWALAGGEHYIDADMRYRDGYLPHNRAPGESGFDLNRWIWERKRRAWRRIPRITVLAVSEWLAARARESVLFRDRRVEVLYNAIDPNIYQPRDRAAARAALGLPAGKPLMLFGAIDATTDKRKGFDLLSAALWEVRAAKSPVELVVFGNAPRGDGETAPESGFRTHYLGAIADPARLAEVYSACDVMVVPSREEAFGQTALEALACGTPVVAFRVGGLPEIIDHGVSGFLARPFLVRELAEYIVRIAAARDRPEWRAWSDAARERVLRDFTLGTQASRCEQLYIETIAAAAPAKSHRFSVPSPAHSAR